jgi:Ca2+-binding RTX toxin-like protein
MANKILGSALSNILYGTSANDIILGEDGNDTLYGLSGNDYVDGGNGRDTLYLFNGKHTADGGAGDDLIYSDAGGHSITGGSGFDTVDYSLSFKGVTITVGSKYGASPNMTYVNSASGTTDVVHHVEKFVGSDYADTMSGNEGTDWFFGGKGNDKLNGNAGEDYLFGGDGDDTLSGGALTDYLSGDAGNDTLLGGDGWDYLWGGDGNDVAFGGTSDDVIFGDAGNDFLAGESGNDTLFGGVGLDTLVGGEGTNHLHCGKAPGQNWPGQFDSAADLVRHQAKQTYSRIDDHVYEFEAGIFGNDVLQISGSSFKSLDDIFAAMKQVGDDVVIKTGYGSSVTIHDKSIYSFDKGDFWLV